MTETTFDVYNGDGPAWLYRGWVMAGTDPSAGLNNWTVVWAPTVRRVGQLGTWSWAGSLHPGGCNILMGDGSVRFLKETTNLTTLFKLTLISDGGIISSDSF